CTFSGQIISIRSRRRKIRMLQVTTKQNRTRLARVVRVLHQIVHIPKTCKKSSPIPSQNPPKMPPLQVLAISVPSFQMTSDEPPVTKQEHPGQETEPTDGE